MMAALPTADMVRSAIKKGRMPPTKKPTTTVGSSKFRVVIPKRLRESIGIFEKTSLFVYASESLIFLRKVDHDKARLLESIGKIKGLEGVGDVK